MLSFSVLMVMFAIVTFFSSRFLNEASEIRRAQLSLSLAHTATLRLIKQDIELQLKDSKKVAFYKDKLFTQSRDRTLELIHTRLETLDNPEINAIFKTGDTMPELHHQLHTYDSLQQKIIQLQRRRGFKDEGLEGRMRENVHSLENFNDVFNLSDILSLRRHEKDYFMRDDLMYVKALNQLSQKLQKSVVPTSSDRQEIALQLLVNYTNLFNEVVKIEKQIGNNEKGLIAATNQQQKIIEKCFEELVRSASSRAETIISGLIRYYAVLILSSVLLATLLGYITAHYVSTSLNKLAISMKEAIASGFTSDVAKPMKQAAEETKSLYKSYQNLISKIRGQLIELENKNTKLQGHNDELKWINNKLAQSESELKESNEIKDKFVSIIGHDLKGPIASITALLELLFQDLENISKTKLSSYAKNILASAQAVTHLLDNLLTWSKTQADRLESNEEEINIGAVMDEALRLVTSRLDLKNIQLVQDFPGHVMYVLADRNMLDFIIRNLIDNAIKFTESGGRIVLKAERTKDQVDISVTDSGVGIPEDIQKHLFDSLIKRQTVGTDGEKGTGLGLIICHEFVKKMNGQLRVDSKIGEGTTFVLSLPLADAPKALDGNPSQSKIASMDL